MSSRAQNLNLTLHAPSILSWNAQASLPIQKITPISLVEDSQKNFLNFRKNVSVCLNDIEFESLKTWIEIITKQLPSSSKAPLLTSGSTSTEDGIANLSFFARTLMPESSSAHAIGVTTGENVFQGFWAAIKASKRFQQAVGNQDREGMVEGGVDALRGISQSIGGAAYLGYRGTMITADIKHIDTTVNATTSLGKSAFILGVIGNVAFLIFYMLIGAWAGYSFTKSWQFSIAMKAHEKSDDQFDFLMHKLDAHPKAKLEKLKKYWEKLAPVERNSQLAAFKENLADVALSRFTEQFLKLQEELSKNGGLTTKPLTSTEVKQILKVLFSIREEDLQRHGIHKTYCSALGLDESDLREYHFSTLELIGFKLEQLRRQQKKDVKMSRVTHDESTEAVKKAVKSGLSERLKCDEDSFVKGAAQREWSDLKTKVNADNDLNKKMQAALVIIAALGVLTTVMGFVALNPIGMIVMTVITLVLVGGMFVTDGHSMAQGWEKGTPGRYDKLYLIVISLVILAAVGLSIGVTLGFGLPILPMIMACMIGAGAIGMSGFSYYKLHQKQKAWIEDHPDLQTFKSFIDTLPNLSEIETDHAVWQLFKKLPKEDRLAIRKTYNEKSANSEFGFRQIKYQRLDIRSDFGHLFICDEIYRDKLSSDKEYQLMVKGMKKTIKLYWQRWAESRDAIDKQRALKLQALYERILQKNIREVQLKMSAIMADHEMYHQLKSNLWYVLRRQDSLADLKQVVESVLIDQGQQNSTSLMQDENCNKIKPLIQRLSGL